MMASFNGQDFIFEQISSIFKQKNFIVHLYISDDGSVDNTLDQINNYKRQNPENEIIILKGPREGYSKNFFSILKRIDINYDIYAFADQDDIWLPQKLERALKLIQKNDLPKIYFSRTTIVDERGNILTKSGLVKKEITFRNSLIQSIGGGNTLCLNNSSFHIIRTATKNYSKKLTSHDWLSYILISAIGGSIFYDSESFVLYRQHKKNIIGSNKLKFSQLNRLYNLFYKKQFSDWNKWNIDFLSTSKLEMGNENEKTLNHFIQCRDKSLSVRIKGFFKSGIYRQSTFETIAIFVAIVFRRF